MRFFALTLLTAACASPSSLEPTEVLVTQLRDEEAIKSLAYCYGRGLDELSLRSADRPKGRAAASALYAGCFDPKVEISVYPVGAKVPFKKTAGIQEWVDFADGFYASAGYSSTRHLMGNFFITRTGAGTATMISYGLAPHFLKSPAKDAAAAAPTLEYYSLRYSDELARQSDGSWRVLKKSVFFDEVWRGVGFFPNGNPDGL
jgi:hypothetical protein